MSDTQMIRALTVDDHPLMMAAIARGPLMRSPICGSLGKPH